MQIVYTRRIHTYAANGDARTYLRVLINYLFGNDYILSDEPPPHSTETKSNGTSGTLQITAHSASSPFKRNEKYV